MSIECQEGVFDKPKIQNVKKTESKYNLVLIGHTKDWILSNFGSSGQERQFPFPGHDWKP